MSALKKIFIFFLYFYIMLSLPYKAYAETYPPATYKHQGQYVLINGNQIWVEKYGTGEPTIILINGAGDTIGEWNSVIPAFSKLGTVVAYDRAGLGKSSHTALPLTKPITAHQVANDLQALIEKLKLTPPFILVGHSIGGLYISYFARNYPKEVSGIVTIDGNTVTQVYWNKLNISGMPTNTKNIIYQFTKEEAQRAIQLEQQNKDILKKKAPSASDYQKLIGNLEVLGKPQSAIEIEKSPSLPSVPLIALTEGTDPSYALWHASIKEFSQQIPCSIFKIVPNSGHYIQIDQPGYVIRSVEAALLAVNHNLSLCKISISWPDQATRT